MKSVPTRSLRLEADVTKGRGKQLVGWVRSRSRRIDPANCECSRGDTLRFTNALIPKTAIEKFFQNGKPGLGRFAPCVAISTRNAVFGCAPGKPEATWVKVPPVELDGSRPKEMSGKRPRDRTCKRGIY